MSRTIENMKILAERYGFDIAETDEGADLLCRNTDGRKVRWIKYNREKETVILKGNTDDLNLWLHRTRPDFTPEKVIQFVKDLNTLLDIKNPFRIRDLIDPEDWQEIADVCDAYEDVRYNL